MPEDSRQWSLVGKRRTDYQTTDTKLGTVTRSSTEVDGLQSQSGTWSRVSLQTPGYGLKKLTGKLPENFFKYSEISSSSLQGYEKYTYRSGVSDRFITEVTSTGIFPGVAYANPWNVSSTIIAANQSNLVKAKVLNKLKQSDINLAVTAGESKETWRMFADTAKYIAGGVKAARSGDASAVRRALGISDLRNFDGVSKKSANAWLMFNYGVKPLINDLQGAVKAYQKGLIRERYYVQSSKNTFEDNRHLSYENGNYHYTEDWTLKIDTSTRVKYEVTDAQLATIASFGITNPFELGWELTKFSFVVDWMVGIGDWLGSLDASLGKTFVGSSVTQFTKTKLAGHRWSKQTVPGYTSFQGAASWNWQQIDVRRTPSASWDIPYLPAFKDNLGLYHVATSVALLRQLKR